jgi:hypothetical protein
VIVTGEVLGCIAGACWEGGQVRWWGRRAPASGGPGGDDKSKYKQW